MYSFVSWWQNSKSFISIHIDGLYDSYISFMEASLLTWQCWCLRCIIHHREKFEKCIRSIASRLKSDAPRASGEFLRVKRHIFVSSHSETLWQQSSKCLLLQLRLLHCEWTLRFLWTFHDRCANVRLFARYHLLASPCPLTPFYYTNWKGKSDCIRGLYNTTSGTRRTYAIPP